jgi:hypothetical protein
MGTVLKRFSITRILRILIGVYFLFAAIGEKSWPMGISGSILLLQGILNTGCGFGTDSCAPNNSTKSNSGFDADKAFRKLEL